MLVPRYGSASLLTEAMWKSNGTTVKPDVSCSLLQLELKTPSIYELLVYFMTDFSTFYLILTEV